ncbi:hypothetical protein PQX77_008247 [Marasmius sp. AFHP31]|nr:hypothetical protein PQX77_008306 [Marasmius sp. AFHP31]KAK1228753.1 hypothetical protein PQX77_008247 [Marasmius sp. AFHP31]
MNGIPIFTRDDLKRDAVNGINNASSGYPSQANNTPDFPPQSHSPFPQAQQMPPMNQSNQWPIFPPNALPPQQQQQLHQQHQPMQLPMPQQIQMQTQQHFNPAGQWNAPIPPPGMPNGMNGMGFFGLGLPPFNMFSQQMFHDAFALSAPVVGADEKLLIETLIQSRAQGENFKDGLNGLHGKNGHSASLWKDYYLEHKERLDNEILNSSKQKTEAKHRVDIQEPKPMKPVKKPVIKAESSPGPSLSTKKRGRPPKQNRRQSSPLAPKTSLNRASSDSLPKSGRRSTINSLTVDAPTYSKDMPPPNSEIRIPEPPSRSPTPPTKIVPKGRGNQFTPEDKEYFIKFVSWRLKCDPDLNRQDLCELLAEKAPHHPAPSWTSYWSNNHDLPDKILSAAHGEAWDEEDEGEEDESEPEKEQVASRQRPRYKDLTSDEEDDEDDAESDEEEETDDEDDMEIPSFDESAMGPSGTAFTEADLAITARYVSTFDDWSSTTFTSKWTPFAEKYKQRTAKSWGEYFRRNEKTIMKLAKRIRKQGITTTSPRGCLSFDGPPRTKRKIQPEDSKDEREAKALKTSAS